MEIHHEVPLIRAQGLPRMVAAIDKLRRSNASAGVLSLTPGQMLVLAGGKSVVEEHLKLRLILDQDSWHELESEGIWVRVVKKLPTTIVAEVDSIPFFAKGLCLGDTVAAGYANGELFLKLVIERSGNSTYRIFVSDEDTDISERLAALKATICAWETAKFRGGLLYALNVPSEASIFQVFRLLREGHSHGSWHYEEGNVGHSLTSEPHPPAS